jgi:hypothetical protein
MGGPGWEQVTGMIMNDNNELCFTGSTGSTTFPTTSNTVRKSHNGQFDAFVGVLATDGSTLLASSFIGGSNKNFASGITLSQEGPFIVGYTWSTNFPTTSNAYQQESQGQTDYFISGLNPTLTSWTYSTYLGGGATDDHGDQETRNGHDAGEIFTLTSKSIWVIGSTRSNNFPVTSNALNKNWNGASDVFVTHINATIDPPDTETSTESTIETTDTNPNSTAFSSMVIVSMVLGIITRFRKHRK